MVLRYKEVKTIFQKVGWLNYFYKMKEGDPLIMMEFMCTYDSVVAEVRGLKFQADELMITRVSGLPQVGKNGLKDEYR